MRGRRVITTLVPPATEPLRVGDEYVVRVGRLMRVRCRVVDSSSLASEGGETDEMIFDATGEALGGVVKARFRFTIFRTEGGLVMARAEEKVTSLLFLAPSRATLESEHRHTFKELDRSFSSPAPSD